MRSFFLFSVMGQSYGIDVDRVQRILAAQNLTVVPDEDEHVQGIFQYEDEVIKVLSFRRCLGYMDYALELQEMFKALEIQHVQWLQALKESVDKGVKFSKTTDAHLCKLGQWLDSFQADTKEMRKLVDTLKLHHHELHTSAKKILELSKENPEQAKKCIKEDVEETYKQTLFYLHEIAKQSEDVAVTFQRCLILSSVDGQKFGINVDAVEDIIHVDDARLHKPKEEQNIGKFMNLEAILEHDNKLVTLVKDVKF